MAFARKPHLDTLAVSLLLACCMFWGFQQVLVKATVAEVAPVFQAFVRFALASAAIAAWCVWRGVRLSSAGEPAGAGRAGLLAGALFAGEFACIYLGLQYTSASRLTVFLYASPFWVALLLPRFIPGERLQGAQWLGLAAAFVGVGLALGDGLLGPANAALPRAWVGDLLGLAAGLMWALTTVVIRSTPLARVAPAKQLFYQVGVSTAVLPVLSLLLGEAWVWQFSPFAWGSLLAQALVGAFVSYLAWMWMLAHYPATRISVFVFLTPVFALLFGAWWLGEPITAGLVAALVLVAAGIVVVNRKPAAA
ncbi:MAG: DMT family transporter [Acidovorax sp.]|uniref:DMT family transporter n=1 Tax=Acidovorax sp. TaxID=1872122 RepID=UPI0025BF650C|nr:DMT family transporter [Acidovorax sp.]MCE1191977.1 DMT family transporter [Acidovorax sp.]